MLMDVALPFPTVSPSAEKGASQDSAPAPEPSRVVTFRWIGIHQGIHDLMMRWIGGEDKVAQNREILQELVSVILLLVHDQEYRLIP